MDILNILKIYKNVKKGKIRWDWNHFLSISFQLFAILNHGET